MKFKVLNQRHPQYKARADIWAELDALYEGGYAVTRPEMASKLLPMIIGEHRARHAARKKQSGYIGYLGGILDEFVSALFSCPLKVTEPTDAGGASDAPAANEAETGFYADFARDADLAGSPFTEIMRGAATTALLKQKALIGVDFPVADDLAEIVTRADEDRAGTSRGYVFEIPVEQLINWKCDKFGALEWAVLYRVRDDQAEPEDVQGDTKLHEFKVWRRRATSPGAPPAVTYEVWTYLETPQTRVNDEADLEVATPPTATSFPTIPIVCCELKHGLWLGNAVGTLQKEHHQRRSALVAGMSKSLVSIPYVKLGSEMGAPGGPMPSEAAMSPTRGVDPIGKFERDGFIVLGAQDELGFAEPPGGAYALTASELRNLKDEMYRVVHQMAAAVTKTASQQAASGDSKREDSRSERIVLEHLGEKVRLWAKQVYDLVAAARKEKVSWAVHGLDTYESDDRAALLEEAVSVDEVAIPSQTFKQEYKTQLALKLLTNAPPELQAKVREEIEEGVAAEHDLQEAQRDAAKKALTAPPAAPGAMPGQPPKPAVPQPPAAPQKVAPPGKPAPPQKTTMPAKGARS